jgi:hypothetical protein
MEETKEPKKWTLTIVIVVIVIAGLASFLWYIQPKIIDDQFDTLNGTLTNVTGGWQFTCISVTKLFPEDSTYVFIQTETGALILAITPLENIDTEAEYNITKVWFHDKDNDDKLGPGDTIFISTDAGTGTSSGDYFHIITMEPLYNRPLP